MRTSKVAVSLLALVAFGAVYSCGQKTPSQPPTPDGGVSTTRPDAGGPADSGEGGEDDGGVGLDGGSDAGDPLSIETLTEITTYLASDALEGRDEGTPGHDAARDDIVRRLAECGVRPVNGDSFLQPITTGQGENIVGRVEGTDPLLKDRHVIISAHYDHIGACGGQICNGANDNAAGVAAIIAVGCRIAQAPLSRSVLIAAWDAEEPPTFLTTKMGSQFYVSNPLVPLERTDVAIVLDLVGSELWPGYADHFVLGAELSPEVGAALSAITPPDGLRVLRGGLHLVEQTPFGQQPWSDYDAFRDAAVPVLFLSDGQNKRYHTPADEISGLSFPKLHREAHLLLALTTQLGNAAVTPTFAASGMDAPNDVETVASVLSAAVATGGMVDELGLSPTSKQRLEADLASAREAERKVTMGEALTATDIAGLRRGAQRVMCLAAPTYPEMVCQQL